MNQNPEKFIIMSNRAKVHLSPYMYLENCIYEKIQKNVKRLEIGKDIRGVILKG